MKGGLSKLAAVAMMAAPIGGNGQAQECVRQDLFNRGAVISRLDRADVSGKGERIQRSTRDRANQASSPAIISQNQVVFPDRLPPPVPTLVVKDPLNSEDAGVRSKPKQVKTYQKGGSDISMPAQAKDHHMNPVFPQRRGERSGNDNFRRSQNAFLESGMAPVDRVLAYEKRAYGKRAIVDVKNWKNKPEDSWRIAQVRGVTKRAAGRVALKDEIDGKRRRQDRREKEAWRDAQWEEPIEV